MSEVARALSNLSQIVGQLEGSVYELETSMSGQQRDMFGEKVANSNAQTNIDTELVAQKLDLAIEKIEDVLEEDQANG